MVKIAICLAGQLRNTKETFPLISGIAQDMSAKVFISTWSAVGAKTGGVFHADQLGRAFGSSFMLSIPDRFVGSNLITTAFPDFEERFNNMYSKLRSVTNDDIERYFHGASIDIEDEELLDLNFASDYEDGNSLRYLYKVWRCNEMKRRYEKETGETFDVVIRMRPDICLGKIEYSLFDNVLSSDRKVIFLPPFAPKFLNDQISISSSETADIFAALFAKALDRNRIWRGIHAELYEHTVASDIEVNYAPLVSGIGPSDDIARKCCRSALLRSIELTPLDRNFSNQLQRDRTLDILAIGDLIEQNRVEEAKIRLNCISIDHLDPDIAASLFCIAAETYLRLGDVNSGFAATVLAWAYRASSGSLNQSQDDYRVCRTLEIFASHLPEKLAVNPFDDGDVSRFLATFDANGIIKSGRNAVADYLGIALKHLKRLSDNSRYSIDGLSHDFMDLFYIQRNFKAAEAVARKMIELSPNDWRGFDYLSHILETAHDLDGALALAQEALALDTTHGGLQCRVGLFLMLFGKFNEAEPYFRRGVEKWPDPMAWAWLAECLERNLKNADAISSIRNAIKFEPNNERYLQILTRLENGGQYRDALDR